MAYAGRSAHFKPRAVVHRVESADLRSLLYFGSLQSHRDTSDALLVLFLTAMINSRPQKHGIIKTETSSSSAGHNFANSTLILHRISRQTSPITHTQVNRLQVFQPVSTELHNQRAPLFPEQSRVVCTHTTSCITAINHVEEITISTRQLQRAVERSN